MSFYKNVVVIGTGRLAKDCLSHLLGHKINLFCLEPISPKFPLLSFYCNKNLIKYKSITDKNEINDYFLSISESTLVVSAYNIHIFSFNVVENSNLFIINFHNSLLPKYRGRNSPTWAIFYMDKFTGITWHKISNEIDKGEIIVQESFLIPEDITAIKLSELCLTAGSRVFSKIIRSLLDNSLELNKSDFDFGEKVYYSHEIPNNGYYDVNWETSKGFAFLRSVDYSNYNVFPLPKLEISGINYEIIEYKKVFVKDKNDYDKILSNRHTLLILTGEGNEYLILILNRLNA